MYRVQFSLLLEVCGFFFIFYFLVLDFLGTFGLDSSLVECLPSVVGPSSLYSSSWAPMIDVDRGPSSGQILLSWSV